MTRIHRTLAAAVGVCIWVAACGSDDTNNGYYSLFQDGELLFEQSDIKTLFDGFEPGSCDMKWALGVYSRWWSAGDGTEDITYYLDDMAIFDRDHGVTIDEVLAWQGWDRVHDWHFDGFVETLRGSVFQSECKTSEAHPTRRPRPRGVFLLTI